MKFSIVIPNYNSEKWIIRLLDSIKAQTYKNYEVIIVDDMSQDNSFEILTNYLYDKELHGKYRLFENTTKKWNGGTRNFGVECADGDYLVFADCDDYFYSENVLQTLSDIIDNEEPDCIRLPYRFEEAGTGNVMLKENTPEELVHSVFIAPWTKCIKRELFIPFPENTLIEDIVQHIAQCDVINTISLCPTPVMVWNRRNENAISYSKRVYSKNSKRYSSIYRNTADLIDLECKHEYCKEERDKRLAIYLDKIHNSKEGELVLFA